jgi:hypothetical protein
MSLISLFWPNSMRTLPEAVTTSRERISRMICLTAGYMGWSIYFTSFWQKQLDSIQPICKTNSTN